MTRPAVESANEAIELIRHIADMHGGWLNSTMYDMCPIRKPTFATLVKLFNVHSWPEMARIAGIEISPTATYPAVLDESHILEALSQSNRYLFYLSESQRKQISVYCLRKAAATRNGTLGQHAYETIAHNTGLVSLSFVMTVYGRDWFAALTDADVKPGTSGIYKRRKDGDGEQSIIDGVRHAAYPADWRTTLEVGLAVCAVTEVTQVYRHDTVPEYGLRYTEQRMQIR